MRLKDTRRDVSVPLAMSTNLYKTQKKTSKLTKKTAPDRKLGQGRPEKHSATCLIPSDEIPSSRQTSIEKADECVMKSGARLLGDPIHPLVTVFTERRYVAGAGQASDTKIIGRWCVERGRK